MLCPVCLVPTSVLIRQTIHGPRDLPSSLRGLNIVRRRHFCEKCLERYWTIEMFEAEFDKLRKPAELMNVVDPKVRP